MDAKVILNVFSGTLQADQSIRQSAENQLKTLAASNGFLEGCLDIISASDSEVDGTIKKAVAVYFKNRVVRYWNHDSGDNTIQDNEREKIKARILPVFCASFHDTKQQLIPVLRVLVSYEFPSKWPDLLRDTGTLLQQVPTTDSVKEEDYAHLYTGILCFTEITRRFRWVDNNDRSKDLDPMIESVFPHLLTIGNSIISRRERMTELSCEILKLILKAYKFVTYFDLPQVLQNKESLISWGEFHGSIINLEPPAYVLSENLTEQEKSLLEFTKCTKWSIANLYRLFTRYASQSLTKKFNYPHFQEIFTQEFLPHLILNYLNVIELYCTGNKWLSSTAVYYLLQFLSHCVTQKQAWGLIRPFFENLVSHFIYPLLCPSDETLELFESDPHEYVHSNFDIYDELDSPDVAAVGLLVTLVDKRKSVTLEPILSFAYNQLNNLFQQTDSLEVAKQKEGALRLIGGISHYLILPKSPYYSQMEQFLKTLVFPNLNSKFEFLRARTLEVSSKFADLEFKENESLSLLFHGITNNFTNEVASCLPVEFECALAIQAYLPMPQFKEALSIIILPTMSKLLELSNEIDSDAISMVMQECVESFSDQLQPFGVDLMSKLVEQFMRLAIEINQSLQVDVDLDAEFEDQSDKVMAAIGLLNTMITVLLSFETSRDICIRLEEEFSPAIEYVLANKLDDFLAEVGELMENSTFLLRSVSPCMWKDFELLYSLFADGIALMYVEELVPCIQNFLVYGSKEISENPKLAQSMCSIFKLIIEGDENQIGLTDISYACEIAQIFILSLQSSSIPFIPSLVGDVLKIAKSNMNEQHHVKNSVFDVNVENVVVAGLVYDSNNVLIMLQESQQLHIFFEQWFELIPMLSRVFDIKLSILGLLSLMSNNDAMNSLSEVIVARIGYMVATLLKALPKAIETLEKKRNNFDADWEDNLDSLSGVNYSQEDFEDGDDSVEGLDNTEKVILEENFKLKGSAFFDEEDEMIVENPLQANPLDGINVFEVFSTFVTSLKNQDVNKYNVLFGSLGGSEEDIIKLIITMTS
ncbi:uncharacterized protein PRCAT00002744001 [Priceomyces carsonii]|uniref:uncharacterized protein n=1 Tax=Priceomyces carsonii TaxID=28549 RepID=UPI002EDAA56F|nr:unnamed protein product [Priceomyces carsonii]